MGALGECLALRVETVGGATQEGGFRFSAGLRVGGEGFGGEPERRWSTSATSRSRRRVEGLAGLRIERLKGCAFARAAASR